MNTSYFYFTTISIHLLKVALCVCVVGLVFFGNTSCSDEDEPHSSKVPSTDAPFLEIETKADMGSASTIQDMLVTAGQDGHLYIWDWHDISKEPKVIELDPKLWIPQWHSKRPPLPDNKVCTLLSPKWIIHTLHEIEDTTLIVRDVKGQGEVIRWAVGKAWCCKQLRSTRSGRFVAVCLDGSILYRVEGVNRRGDRRAYRLGVIGPGPKDIQWLPTFFRREGTLPGVYAVAVSEDGNYVCAVGTCNGGWIMLVDVAHKKVVWEKLPKGEDVPYGRWTVAFNNVCFSPDGKHIYVSANIGLLRFDAATGKIIKQWPMPGRVASVAVSPDERLVAGGLPGDGDVYICDVNSVDPLGTPLLRLRTDQYSVFSLDFSPDSTLLATEGVLNTNIKIWKMPAADLETTSPTREN